MSAGPVPASPAVRKLAREKGVDPTALAGELGQTTVSKADVLRKAGGGTAGGSTMPSGKRDFWDVDHAAYGPGEWVALTNFERVAAENLTASLRNIPAVTHHDRIDMTIVEAFRGSLRQEADERAVRLTALAFHVKALTRALAEFPKFNASLSPDGSQLWLKHHFDIGIAVDTPHGLMVPVLRGCDTKKLWQIAADIGDFAARAQARKVRPDEFGGASMSITNLGAIGGRGFSPVINPPEVAILGLTRASMEPVWDGETFQPALMCPIDLTYDHRVINGADAARFVSRYAALMGDPRKLLL